MKEIRVEDYTTAELMAVLLAREIKDGELGGVGAASQVPMAAIRLAQLTHAPNVWWFCGGSGAINSKVRTLLDSAADYRNLFQAEARISMEDIVDCELRVRFDFGFVGGLQIDKYGNVNMVCVGDYSNPAVRGPGTVGVSFVSSFRRKYYYLTHHDPKVLVDKVDFISGAGFLDGSGRREQFVHPAALGPCMMVTPIAVFDFDEVTRRARLKSVHPGKTIEEVVARTGFEPIMPPAIAVTERPTQAEMIVLRTQVDPQGVLRKMRLK